jgi:hypothetical protein
LFCGAATNLTEATQINCILPCRTAKNLGKNCKQKQLELTAFSSAAQRKFLELRTRALYFVRRPARNFGISHQRQNVFVLAYSKEFWNLSTQASHIDLFCRTAQRKILRCEQALYFVQPRSENFWVVNKSTFFGSAAQRKTLEFTNKSNSNQLYLVLPPKALYFVQPAVKTFDFVRSEKFWN